jgi:hypothetical protein
MLPAVAVQTLPGLVQRAASQLASATSAAEVLEARDMASVAYDAAKKAARLAKARGAFNEIVAKANHAQADALEIEALANRRIADEYDAAQARGEVKAANNAKTTSNAEAVSAPDIGLTHKEVHEARKIRDAEEADPGIVRRTLDEALEAGQEPTRAAVRRATGKPRHRQLSAAGKELAKLRQAWRAARPAVRQHFLTEITEKVAA